jgi:hypothetical protein
MLRAFLLNALIPVVVLCGCFGPFDPTDPPPDRTSDPDAIIPAASAAGIIAWWNCNDSSESVLSDSLGKYPGSITSCTRTSGIEGGGLRFNGSGSYVSVTPSGSSPFDFNEGDFTVSVWVKPEMITMVDDSTRLDIIARGAAEVSGFVLTIVENKFAAILGSYVGKSRVENFPDSTKDWRHVVLTRSNGEVTLFVDNTPVINFTNSTSVKFNQSLPLLIGRDSSNRPYPYNGFIDEIKIFNIAWDASDVAREYGRFR